MDALEAILTRRSIRRYTTDAVPDELIDRLLRAAMAAPSAGNQQPWEFVVVRDRTRLGRLAEIHEHAQMAPGAAAAILVCGRTEGLRHPEYWQQDCAAAVQNLLLGAHALGLGAVWCGIYPKGHRVSAFCEEFGLPAGVEPLALVVLGFAAEKKGPADRFDESRVHRETW